jgi:hypothetical protein
MVDCLDDLFPDTTLFGWEGNDAEIPDSYDAEIGNFSSQGFSDGQGICLSQFTWGSFPAVGIPMSGSYLPLDSSTGHESNSTCDNPFPSPTSLIVQARNACPTFGPNTQL